MKEKDWINYCIDKGLSCQGAIMELSMFVAANQEHKTKEIKSAIRFFENLLHNKK